ncbi:calcium-independent phospholipase A2-gamma-like isoform X2 [Pantherophis guttatus]|uniref:Calcium-independent phospholipase A2-gamma isoform X2 n=1 Tax=Pantherophis guttatus TaxID=94885 RepID=A0ABM3Z9F2_PANGU|nr:calcium-independent phospholipase A2-gamma isoform X2 [Pantherophis guttatus]XP_060545002.1 calcium-independent phospholipase A2-gamma-like isoform X2 [Pantherophis guttatus]
MSIQFLLDKYVYLAFSTKSLWSGQRTGKLHYFYKPELFWRTSYTPFRVLHTSSQYYKWTRSKTEWQKYLYFHYCLGYRISKFSTSKELSKNNRMSRLKNTLESVSKAVSGTHSELVSRLARLKPQSAILKKSVEADGKENGFLISSEKYREVPSVYQEDYDDNLHEKKTVSADGILASVNTSQGSLKDPSDIKNSLFHVSKFATNFGETYNFVAHHINWYFSTVGMDQEKKVSVLPPNPPKQGEETFNSSEDDILSDENRMSAVSALVPASRSPNAEKVPSSIPSKKGISSFLSYPSNSVQAFVDSYIGGLVPKLRSDTKSAVQEKTKEQEQEDMLKDDKEAKRAEEKEKRLNLQREKIIAKVSVDNRTRALTQALRRSSTRRVCINRVEELTYHLLEFPDSRGIAIKENVIPCLLKLRQTKDEALQAAVREALAVIGYTDPVKGWGIRILSIDGGGTRGLVALQTLRKLEELTGKPIHQLFDYICGVSTGAILGFMLGLFHIPLDECEELYRKLGTDVFKQNVIVGTVKMGWSHAFYDSEIWEKMLKERMGSDVMFETARNPKCPKDGGLLINNPTALAVHECRCLWPNVPLQCVVSLGTGRYENHGKTNVTYTSLKAKLTNVISSATDTEEVHIMLDALLPPDTYFRFNPLMNEDIPLDENRKEKLNKLRTDGIRYLERNDEKLKKASKILSQEKNILQKLSNWMRLKADMYDGLPILSKL